MNNASFFNIVPQCIIPISKPTSLLVTNNLRLVSNTIVNAFIGVIGYLKSCFRLPILVTGPLKLLILLNVGGRTTTKVFLETTPEVIDILKSGSEGYVRNTDFLL